MPSRENMDRMIAVARVARNNAFCPASGFHVGAALLDSRGNVYPGCNVESAAYPVTMCAERGALAAAVADGARNFEAIMVMSNAPKPCPPCGMCRQALIEFGDMMVFLVDEQGVVQREYMLSVLLPDPFNFETMEGKAPVAP